MLHPFAGRHILIIPRIGYCVIPSAAHSSVAIVRTSQRCIRFALHRQSASGFQLFQRFRRITLFGSSRFSPTHTPSMMVFRPQFTKVHPIVRCGAGHPSSYSEGGRYQAAYCIIGPCCMILCWSWTNRRAHTGVLQAQPEVMELPK